MEKVYECKSVFVTGLVTIYKIGSQKIGKRTERAFLPRRISRMEFRQILRKKMQRSIRAVDMLFENHALGPWATPNTKLS